MNKLSYLLVPLVALLLVSGQAMWGSFIKNSDPFHGSLWHIISRFAVSPQFWAGALLYVGATAVYFIVLSKYHFFTAQVVITALAVVLASLLAKILFHEALSPVNILGMLLVVSGIGLVLIK